MHQNTASKRQWRILSYYSGGALIITPNRWFLIFEPDFDLEVIRPKPFPPRNAAVRGDLSRIVFASLRQSKGPLTAQEIAQHVMAERGLNTADTKLVRLIGKRVGACLRHQRDKGFVRSEAGQGQCLVWTIIQ